MPPLNIGLTGNIGSGKSTVAALFARHGAAVIDADALAREATEAPEILLEIAEVFGSDLVARGVLDRARLAEIVFADSEARARLGAIVHPWVARSREAEVARLAGRKPPPKVIVHDVPLLFEAGLAEAMDKTVVVDAPLGLRVARVVARSGLTEAEVRSRDAAQLPLAEKVARADFVIDSSGGLELLAAQVADLWLRLLKLAQGS